MEYEYFPIQDHFKAKNYHQPKQLLYPSLQLASSQPMHLIKEKRLKKFVHSERKSQKHEFMGHHLTDFSLADFEHQKQNSIESMYFDYTKIDDGKIQMDFNFTYPLLKKVSYQIAMFSQANGLDDVKNYPLKQTGPKHLSLYLRTMIIIAMRRGIILAIFKEIRQLSRKLVSLASNFSFLNIF